MTKDKAFALLAALGCLALTACHSAPRKPAAPPPTPFEPSFDDVAVSPPPPVGPRTLYDRLGGRDGIKSVVDDLCKNIAADPRISKMFTKRKGDPWGHFNEMLSQQLCQVSGGPCKYTGKDMKPAHKGMSITDGQFNAFIEDLSAALDTNKIGENEKSDLFAAIGKMKEDIVEKKSKK